MKKIFSIIIFLFSAFCTFAQTHSTVEITDEVYGFLMDAEVNGLCAPLENVRPYSEKYILEKLNEILESLNRKGPGMEGKKEIVSSYIKKFEYSEDGFNWRKMNFKFSNHDEERPITLNANVSTQMFFSGSLYSDSTLNSFGYETWGNVDFRGDLGQFVSYKTTGFLGLTKMALKEMGDYKIGEWWYDEPESPYDVRTIKKLKNFSVMPYSYIKHWDGSCYHLSNLSASGLEGWPNVDSLIFGMTGEIRANLFGERLDISASRVNREWAGMDKGSSLVLNSNARPFFGVDASLRLFDFLSFSILTGILEFPNQHYINSNAFYLLDSEKKQIEPNSDSSDAEFFQNAFSVAMLNLNYKNFHFDFGSTAVWPKRFELGYMFPLLDRVMYQNDIGDYDNMSLFCDASYTFPRIAKIWGSLYIDELSNFKDKFWEKTRFMYAYQTGAKINFPWLPFSSVSLRYTKVEPYCYTHNSIRYQPWYYGNYISTSYTNNGYSLGYYLDPNSDEFLLRFETNPIPSGNFAFQFQLIRHGVDWGSEAVDGSNIYSEFSPRGRDDRYKYFLHDGVYEWITALGIDGSYNFAGFGIPVQLNASLGYFYNWFTKADGGANNYSDYHRYNSSEYQDVSGVVLSMGVKAFF